MVRIESITKLTDFRWLNVYRTTFINKVGQPRQWLHASRNDALTVENGPGDRADAVVVVPILVAAGGERRLVMIREFRVPIRGVETGFPAGLVDGAESYEEAAGRELKEETGLDVTRVLRTSPPLYASPGMIDESAVMVFVECSGTPSTAGTESDEDIEVMLLDHVQVRALAADATIKVSAKAWPVLYLFEQLGHL
jgi:ADP-ribose pyrophosphatase